MANIDGNVVFVGDFDDGAERDLIVPLTKEIQKQRNLKDGRIDLYINSFGGYAHLVFHLISLIEVAKRDGVVVRTIVPSVAFSAGSMLAVTGTPGQRYIDKGGEHLIHYGSTGSMESTPTQVERYGAWKSRDFARTLEHYRHYADVPNLDRELMDDGFFIPAPKCIKWGLADKLLTKFDIGDPE